MFTYDLQYLAFYACSFSNRLYYMKITYILNMVTNIST